MRADKPLQARRWTCLTALLLLCAVSSIALAQESGPQLPSQTADSTIESLEANSSQPKPVVPAEIQGASGRIQYVGPDTYILLDKSGKPQPVPGMTYEDFLEAWKKSQQPAAIATPRYILESIKFDGRVKEDFAEVDFTATVQLLTDERVQVPLGLIGAILQSQPSIETVAADDVKPPATSATAPPSDKRLENFVAQDDQGGFVANLSAAAKTRQNITLQLIVPILRDGNQASLQLSCPRAVASRLTFTTTRPVAEASISTGTLLAQVPAERGGTRIEAVGVTGPFRLTWTSADQGQSDFSTVLSAAGAIRVNVDGRSVRTHARLTVQSYGGDFDRLRIRLPPGAQLIPDRPDEATSQRPSYHVSNEERATKNGAAGEAAGAGQVVLVQFTQKQRAPATIELSTEQPIGLDDGGSSAQLAGFEVLGAVRQFGDVAVNVANDWQARWDLGPHVRQVDVTDLDPTLSQADVAAAFQYDRQPWSLNVHIAARQTRIHVSPHYELQCLPDEARLTARFTYQVSGARAFEFRVRLEGWQMAGDPLESGGFVDTDEIVQTGDGTLILGLAQAAPPRAEITLSLRRTLRRDQAKIELPFPVPIAHSTGTGDVVVRTSADTALQTDLENSNGLTPVAGPQADELEPVNGEAIYFRTLLPEITFVANRARRPQVLSAQTHARIEMAGAEAIIEQDVDYEVDNVALRELVFKAPSDLPFDENQVEVTLLAADSSGTANPRGAESPLNVIHSPEDFESIALGGTARFRVILPQPRLGEFSVRLRYRSARPNGIAPGGAWRLPLVLPADARLGRATATVLAPRNVAVSLGSQAGEAEWSTKASAAEARGAQRTYNFASERASEFLPVVISTVDFEPPSATIVDRIWLQTWLAGDMRQDRASIRFRTAGTQATVELPPDSAAEEIEVLLDGKPADVASRSEERIVVRLAGNGAATGAAGARLAEHTMELCSREQVRYGLLTQHRLMTPQLVGSTTLSQIYWQIILPSDQHIVRSPARMTSASQWQWLGSFWGLRPAMTQDALEQWSGASPRIAPKALQNQYLYTGLAPVLTIELVTAPRWLVVLVTSSVFLAVGLAWLYIPAVRRRWMLAALAIIVAVLSIAFPAPALLLAQAGAIGLIVTLFAVVLNRLLARPSHWPIVATGTSSQMQRGSRTDSFAMPPIPAAASTAPTVPLRLSDSER